MYLEYNQSDNVFGGQANDDMLMKVAEHLKLQNDDAQELNQEDK